MVNTCNKPEWLSAWTRDGRNVFLYGKQGDTRSVGFILDDIKICCQSSDQDVQKKALYCWKLWINEQTDWKQNHVCFQAIEPLVFKKKNLFHNCHVELYLKRLELFHLLINKVGSWISYYEGPVHVLEKILESCLIWLSSKEMDKQVHYSVLKFLRAVFSPQKDADGMKESATAVQVKGKLFGRLLDKFLQAFPVLWEKLGEDKTDFIYLWGFVLELSEQHFESISVQVWHKILRLVRRVSSDHNEKFQVRLIFLHKCATILKSVMNNSKYLDLNNVDTTPSQELLSQLVEMCSKSNGKYDAMECFLLCEQACQVLTENIMLCLGDVSMCTSILNKLDDMSCKTCLWGLWTGMLKTFENARANNLHPQDKNKLYRKLRGTAVNFVLDVVDLDPRCITMIENKVLSILGHYKCFRQCHVVQQTCDESKNEELNFEQGNFRGPLDLRNNLVLLVTLNISFLNVEKNVLNCSKFVLKRLQISITSSLYPQVESIKGKIVRDGMHDMRKFFVRKKLFSCDYEKKRENNVKCVALDTIELQCTENNKLSVEIYDFKTHVFRLQMYKSPFADYSYVYLYELCKSLHMLNKNASIDRIRQKQSIIYNRMRILFAQLHEKRRNRTSETGSNILKDGDHYFLQVCKSLQNDSILKRKTFYPDFFGGSTGNSIVREEMINYKTKRKRDSMGDSSFEIENSNRKRKRQQQDYGIQIRSKNFKFNGMNGYRKRIGVGLIKTAAKETKTKTKSTTPPRNCKLNRKKEIRNANKNRDRAADGSVDVQKGNLQTNFLDTATKRSCELSLKEDINGIFEIDLQSSIFDDKPSNRAVTNTVESNGVNCVADKEKRDDTESDLKKIDLGEQNLNNYESRSSIQNRASRMLALISNSNLDSTRFKNHSVRRKDSTNVEKAKERTSYIKTSRATRLLALIPLDDENSFESSPVKNRTFDKKSFNTISENEPDSITTILSKSPGLTMGALNKSALCTPPKKKSLRFDEDKNEYMLFFTDSPPTESSRKFRPNPDRTIDY